MFGVMLECVGVKATQPKKGKKKIGARIPDPRANATHPCSRSDVDDIKALNSKSMPMQYARQYARAITNCRLLFRR